MIDPAARIMVINTARIGDVLMMTPVLQAIKSACPQGRLACRLHPGRRVVLEGLPWIDDLRSITPKTAWWRGRWGPERWDYALVYGTDEPLIRYALRVARRIVAYEQKDEGINRMLWRAVPRPTPTIHGVLDRMLLPAAIGITTDNLRLGYLPSPAELRQARVWLGRNVPAGAQPLVGFQVAGFPTRAFRNWPPESYAELGKRILSSHPNAHILILGDSESRKIGEYLAANLGGHATSTAGRFKFRHSAALMAHLNLYVGIETGPTHLAGALEIPAVGIYHCLTRSKHLAPIGNRRFFAVDHPTADEHCTRAAPMSDITVAMVWEKVQPLLATAQVRE